MKKVKYHKRNLGDFIHIKHGYAFKSEYFEGSGKHVVLTPGHFFEIGGFRPRPDKDRFYIGDYPKDYLLDKGDLIVAMTEQGEGLLGSTALVPLSQRYLHNQRIGLVSIKNSSETSKKFLYYLFNTSLVRQQIRNSSSGTKVRHTSPERIYRVQARIPSAAIQQKIAAVLSAYDDLIENNNRRIALLEKMAEEIYREWFVRLRCPGHEGVAFHKGIPEGWISTELSELIDIRHGYAFKGEFFRQEPTQNVLLTPGNFAIGGGFQAGKLKYYDGPVPTEYILKTNDLIVTMTDLSKKGDTLGYPAFVPPSQDYRYLHNQRLGRISIRNKNLITNSFLYYVFCSTTYRYHVVGSATGTTVKHTAPDRIRSFEILLPDKEVIHSFEKIITPLRREITVLNQKNSSLQQTRDRLLTRLISGKLSVEDLDIQFPPSMTDEA